MAKFIRLWTFSDEVGVNDDRPLCSMPFKKKRNADQLLAVTAKVEDGSIKAAIRILCSEEKPATDVKTTYDKLLERQP